MARHEDDSYGACVICRIWTGEYDADDEPILVGVPFPCAPFLLAVPTDVPGLRAALAELVHLNTLKPYGHVGLERLPWFTHNPTSHAEGAECRSCSAVAAGRAALAASQPVPTEPEGAIGRTLRSFGAPTEPEEADRGA